MKIKHLMTKGDLLTVGPYTPILNAVDILVKKRFNGLPVVNKDGTLLGILTQHDMMLRGSDMHLPTLIHILNDIGTYGRDKKFISQDMKEISLMKTSDIMNANPITLAAEAPVEDALKIFSEHHDVNPLLIIGENKKLVGILSRYDMLKLFGEQTTVENELQAPDREIDLRIRETLPGFQNKFLFVSRMRVTHWLLVSLGFGVVGFISALIFMLRFV